MLTKMNPAAEMAAAPQEPDKITSTTACQPLAERRAHDAPAQIPQTTNVLQRELHRRGQEMIDAANELSLKAREAHKAGDYDAAEQLQNTALEKLKEGHRMQNDPAFAGGLSANNAKHMLGSSKVSQASSLRSQASSLESAANRAAATGDHSKASSLRNQASSLRSQASRLESEGRRLMQQADQERKKR